MCTCTSKLYSRFQYNLTKIRPLFKLSHRGSDNSSLLIVFMWIFYELCICILHHDFDQSAYFKHSAAFWSWWKSFSCHLILVAYSDQKVKMSEISAPGMEVRIWMINLISTEPLSSNGELSDPLCYSKIEVWL